MNRVSAKVPPLSVDLAAIRDAAGMLAGRIIRTPTVPAEALSRATGADIRLKLETLQATGSFKVRGAYVKLAGLDAAARRAGVVAASAGNHAQGVAWHARTLGIPATIVMPRGTPFTKIGRTRALGARVILEGAALSDAQAFALRLGHEGGLTYVHPYDDDDIIRGQGTVALEMLADAPDLDCLVVPVGGGGLIAGMAVAARALKPEIEIIGVEAALYPAMRLAMRGEIGLPGQGSTVAEGIAVTQPGERTRPLIHALVDEIVLVDEAALEHGIYTLLDAQRLVAEGAAAATLAAVRAAPERFAGRVVGLVISGGNIDPLVLSSILLRGLARNGRLARLRIQVADAPGSLAHATAVIAEAGGNVIEVEHRRLFWDVPVKMAEVEVTVEMEGAEHARLLMDALATSGLPARLLAGTVAAERDQAMPVNPP
jgi:threonine dehydratase